MLYRTLNSSSPHRWTLGLWYWLWSKVHAHNTLLELEPPRHSDISNVRDQISQTPFVTERTQVSAASLHNRAESFPRGAEVIITVKKGITGSRVSILHILLVIHRSIVPDVNLAAFLERVNTRKILFLSGCVVWSSTSTYNKDVVHVNGKFVFNLFLKKDIVYKGYARTRYKWVKGIKTMYQA